MRTTGDLIHQGHGQGQGQGNTGGHPSWPTREDGGYVLKYPRFRLGTSLSMAKSVRTWRKRGGVTWAKRKNDPDPLGSELGAHGGEKDVSESCTPDQYYPCRVGSL